MLDRTVEAPLPIVKGEMSTPWREAVKRKLPGIVHFARLARMLRNQIKFPIVSTVLDVHGRILAGPFAGLRYPRSGINGYYEVLGTYEYSLVPLINDIVRRAPKVIIDVGAAYGYYALGFAQQCPDTLVIAYEMDKTRVALLEKYRERNGLTQQILTKPQCTLPDLENDLRDSPDALIFMDVEGAEDFLLLPDKVPALRTVEILVELHDMFVPGVSARISERFADTHEQVKIEETPTDYLPIPKRFHALLRPFWKRLIAVNRGRNTWLHLVPKHP